jgi:phytoene synthase
MNEQYLELLEKIDFKRIIDHPNILIAAAFWEEDRYRAARVCYKYMRAIDDLIDCHKSVHSVIAENEKDKFIQSVQSWIKMIKDREDTGNGNEELIDTVSRFHIPAWPMEAFAKSMIYDINHSGFSTIEAFLEYSQGASVAPASVFVHLNGLISQDGKYLPPLFDVKSVATPCALFSYIVHIIRDFQKDQLNNLNYFAEDEIAKNGMTSSDLRKIAEGAPIPAGFRNMIRTYCKLAIEYRDLTFKVIEEISPLLEPRYKLSLWIIFNLYLMVFERINIDSGKFTAEELNPSPEEIKDRVYKTILDFKA